MKITSRIARNRDRQQFEFMSAQEQSAVLVREVHDLEKILLRKGHSAPRALAVHVVSKKYRVKGLSSLL